jgi:neurexin
MQEFIFNGKSYFELIHYNEIPNIVNKTVKFLQNDIIHKYPITFGNTNSWIELPKIDATQILLIQFHFKTSQENGLIMYNPGINGDFLSIELVEGQISYSFSLGKGIHELKSNIKKSLNDNKWHTVSIWRSTRTNHELNVDSILYKHSLVDEKHLIFNLVESLSIGGLKNQSMYENLKFQHKMHSFHGFEGCLASIEINGQIPNLDHVWTNENKMNGNISKGCGGRNVL